MLHRVLGCCLVVVLSVALLSCGGLSRPRPQSIPTAAAAVCEPVTSDATAAMQKDPGYRQIAVSVKDESGREVQHLGKDDFIIKVGDETRAVEFVQYQPNGPLTVLILADTSGSTETKLPQTRVAITQIVDNLDPRDDVSLFAFSGKPFNLQGFTRVHSSITDRESLLHAYGSTSLFDSVDKSLRYLENGCYAKRSLVVISDGIDNTSHFNMFHLEPEVRSSGVSIYAIAIGNPDARGRWFNQDTDRDGVNPSSLTQLATLSGGATFAFQVTSSEEVVAAAAKSITGANRGQYVVGFIEQGQMSSDAATIQIKNHPKYIVTQQKNPATTPTGVTAPSTSS